MTYFGILATFIVPPTLILLILVPRDVWRWVTRRDGRVNWEPYWIILGHVALALIYTTPWDNYLVATNVWWYDPDRVAGITLGWVPVEEYTFFVVQTLMSGLWTLALGRSLFKSPPQVLANTSLRRWASAGLAVLWLVSTLPLVLGWAPGTYLSLILAWGLIPVLVQIAFGADILLAYRRLLVPAITVPTLYLWLVDAVAISGGTWTIDPAQTTGIKLGPLPLEEMVFFLMTNLIIGFGVTLMSAEASKARARAMRTQPGRRPAEHSRRLSQESER
jgi:lycopene cyclase domain-containing protein